MWKKRAGRAVSVLVFCILFGLSMRFLGYLVNDDTKSYTRVAFHEMYEQDNIDALFIGSSHCYRSFDPDILDEKLGMNTFNGGTSGQKMDGSLMILKEAARYNDIKHVYLDVYYSGAMDVRKNRTGLTSTYIISDYMKPSLDKLLYLLKASGPEHYANSFLKARRNWDKLLDPGYIRGLIQKKSTDEYKNFGYKNLTGKNQWYVGKGFVSNDISVKNWDYFSKLEWRSKSVDRITDDWLESINGIIDFCEKKGIKLTFVVTPMSNFLLTAHGDYDDYLDYVRELIGDHDIELYDFNLCKEEYIPNSSEIFQDEDHLNGAEAEKFSALFADVMNGDISPDDLFYDSYAEKMDNIDPMVFGVMYHETDASGEQVRECRVIANKAESLEYEISFEPEDEEAYVLQDYSPETIFELDDKAKGILVIRYRASDTKETVDTVNVTVA